MSFHLRIELPDVPGSLGALATALGDAGADILVIETVERRTDGFVVNDVLLELPGSVMPDSLITACHGLDGVHVHWISRYAAGANVSMDLEAVESFTDEPSKAIEQLVEVMPATIRADWAMALIRERGAPKAAYATGAAPRPVTAMSPWLDIDGVQEIDDVDDADSSVLAAAPARLRRGRRFVLVVGRHGGPPFLRSELARLGHMASLAASVQDPDEVTW